MLAAIPPDRYGGEVDTSIMGDREDQVGVARHIFNIAVYRENA